MSPQRGDKGNRKKDAQEAFAEDETTDYKFLNTVDSNKSCFHRREIKGADGARILQQLLGWPSTQKLKEAIQKNQIRNCLITTDDISRAEAIYGPQIPIIQGKAIRRIPEHHKTIPRMRFPPITSKHHHNVPLIFICKWEHFPTHKIKLDRF